MKTGDIIKVGDVDVNIVSEETSDILGFSRFKIEFEINRQRVQKWVDFSCLSLGYEDYVKYILSTVINGSNQ